MAGESNPTRIGMFVRVIRREGRVMNPGTWWECTDGRGEFWQIRPETSIVLDTPPPMVCYSAALDEVWNLRKALAYEACAVEADLTLKSFPKSRRALAENRVERMRRAAQGEVLPAYSGSSTQMLQQGLAEAGAGPTMTRYEWEEQQGWR